MRLRTVAVAHTDLTGLPKWALNPTESQLGGLWLTQISQISQDCNSGRYPTEIPTWRIVAHTDPTDLTGLPKWALNPTLNRTDCECATK